jgi:EAL domain-containing protein (putative c-di-GMP-specific phosphodiesterase class I)
VNHGWVTVPDVADPTLAPLIAAADALDEAVLIVDAMPLVTHANAAASLMLDDGPLVGRTPSDVLGIGISELLGQNTLISGPVLRPVPGAGSGLIATVIAVRDHSGAMQGSLVVLRDLARDHHDQRWLAQLDADRAALLAMMDKVRPGDDLSQTVTALCDALQTMDWIDGAMIMLTPKAGSLINVTPDMPPELGLTIGGEIPTEQLDLLIAVTERGPWYLDLLDPKTREFVNADLLDGMLSVGIRASAYAAIRADEELVGVLSIASMADDASAVLAGRLGSVQDLAHLAGAVIRNQALTYNRTNALRVEIEQIIEERAFTCVFQPILELTTGQPRWYEALTRFADGTRPDIRFAAARDAGVDARLEEATARVALESAADLPREIPLSLNFSPDAILGGVLTRLGDPGRPIVVEITEHARTGEYGELRETLSEVTWATVAVDDAGAGYASLRHILELKPQYVKLDIGLVHEVDIDPARAAMVAGVRHFAEVTGTRLVAEGIETEAQAAALRELGVEFGQGFLFGRPGPLP